MLWAESEGKVRPREYEILDNFDIFPSGLGRQIEDAKRHGLLSEVADWGGEGHKTWRFTPTSDFIRQWRELRQQPVHRQVTVDGRAVDLRNRANFDLLNADIKDVENVAYSWLHELRTTANKRVKRGVKLALQRTLLLRGRQLPQDLYDTINLRIRGQLSDIADDIPDQTALLKGSPWQATPSHEPWT
jgi:hypothetical protein